MKIGNFNFNFTINNAKEYKDSNLVFQDDSREVQLNVGDPKERYPMGKPPFGSAHRTMSNLDGSNTVGFELSEEAWEKFKTVVSNVDGDTWYATLERPKNYAVGGPYYWDNWDTPEDLKASLLDYIFRSETADVIHVIISKDGIDTPASKLMETGRSLRFMHDPFRGLRKNSTQTIDLEKINEEYTKGQIESQKAVAKGIAEVTDSITKINEHLEEQKETTEEAIGENQESELAKIINASILTKDGKKVDIDINLFVRHEHMENKKMVDMLEKLLSESFDITYNGTAESLQEENFNFNVDFADDNDNAPGILRIWGKDKDGKSQLFTLSEDRY